MAKALVQGANRGLGLQFTKSLMKKGTSVVACCRNPQNAKDLLQLKEDFPTLLNITKLEVTCEEDIISVSEYVKSHHEGKLDLIINCSGILHPSGRGETNLKEVSSQGLQSTFNVNTFGPLLMGKHFGSLLQAGSGIVGQKMEEKKQQHTGILVNMSARVGSIGDNKLGGWYSYRMSKAALNMATKNLSIELGRGPRKVVCVALHPGTVDTDLSRPYHKNVPKDKLFSTEESVHYLMAVINKLSIKDSGKYLDWQGKEIPY